VFLGGLGAALAAALPEEPRLAELLRAAGSRRAEAYAALRRALDGPEFRTLACDAIALALRFLPAAPGAQDAAPLAPRRDEAPPPREPLDRFAAAALDRRWRKLCARGEAMSASLEDEALHALRLEAKRMRYAAEIFAPLWPGKASRRFVRRLAALQEALGLANDAAQARRLVAGLESRAAARRGAGQGGSAQRHAERHAWAIGLVEGFALARARRVRKRALRAWEALLRCAPFWGPG
jgi:CHAD domain-containing protein